MKRLAILAWCACLIIGTAQVDAQQSIKISNSLSKPVELKIFSEKKLEWLKPTLKIEPGETSEFTVSSAGNHNLKLIVEGSEHLLGTFDLKSAIESSKIDSIELVEKKNGQSNPGPSTTKGDPGFRLETRMRYREVAKEIAGRTVTTKIPETYIMKVPNGGGKAVEISDPKEIAKLKKQIDSFVKSTIKTKKDFDPEKYRFETRTRTVAVTKTRQETRTRTVAKVVDGKTVTETVPYTVSVPYQEQVTQNYEVAVPVDGGVPIPLNVPTHSGKPAATGKFRTETRTRNVKVTKMRPETRTRMVKITKADGTVEEQEQTYTVMIPYTEMVTQEYQIQVPVDKDAASGKSSTASAAEYTLTFKSGEKTIQIKDSFKDSK